MYYSRVGFKERESWLSGRDEMISRRDDWIAERDGWIAERDQAIESLVLERKLLMDSWPYKIANTLINPLRVVRAHFKARKWGAGHA